MKVNLQMMDELIEKLINKLLLLFI